MTQEQIDSIRERMCDGYCAYPKKWPIAVARDAMVVICHNCPLNELEASE